MSFLQSAAPYIAPIAGVAGLIAGRGPNIGGTQFNLGKQAASRSTGGLNDAYSYYRGVTNGGPQLQQAVAPAANAIDQTYDAALKSGISGQYGRGGSLDKTIRTIQSGRAFSLADLYGNAQREGATGLAQLSGSDASRAAGLLGDANVTNQQNQKNNSAAFSNIGSILMRLFGGNANHPNIKNGIPQSGPAQGPWDETHPEPGGQPGVGRVIGTNLGQPVWQMGR